MRHLRRQLPILLLLLPAVLQAQHPLTPPFRVDVSDGQRQDRPLVAMSPRGDFVVTWLRLSPDSQGYSLYARRFAADGTPVTDEILVTGQARGQQVVTMMEDGSFVVVFLSPDLVAHGFGPDGTLAYESPVLGKGKDPVVAARSGGGFVLVWTQGDTVLLRIVGGDGRPVGPARRVGWAGLGTEDGDAVAVGPDGDLVVAWIRVRSLAGNPQRQDFTLFARRLDASGAAEGEPFVVRDLRSGDLIVSLNVARDASGGFLVQWGEITGGTGRLLARRYTAQGPSPGGLLRLVERPASARLAMDPAGNFVLVWQIGNAGGHVFAQRFTSGGAPFRPSFRADVTAIGRGGFPDVATRADGDFGMVWSGGLPADATAIYARLYRKR